MAASPSTAILAKVSGGWMPPNPIAGSVRVNLKGTFQSRRYPSHVHGVIILSLFHDPSKDLAAPYQTYAYIVFTGRHKNSKTRRLRLAVGVHNGMTAAFDATGKFRMYITEARNTRRNGWVLKGHYNRTEPSDEGKYRLREIFPEDDFSSEEDEEEARTSLAFSSGGECSIS